MRYPIPPQQTVTSRRPKHAKPLAALLAVATAVTLAFAQAASAHSLAPPTTPLTSSLTPAIIGGQPASIEQYPWQVYIEGEYDEGGSVAHTQCGGSILSSTIILTAAHCTDLENSTQPVPAADYTVMAGNSYDYLPSGTMQVRSVAAVRRDPLYSISPVSDDVALMQLSSPLELSPAVHAEAIGIVAENQPPAPGTSLRISGYGRQAPNEEGFDRQLSATTLTASNPSSENCQTLTSPDNAVLLCAESPTSSTCQGDSGGPLVEGTPAVQVGIVDFGKEGCPTGFPDAFTNLAAPEIRAFLEGNESPPQAARDTAVPKLSYAGTAPTAGAATGCEAGTWTDTPTLSYAFQTASGATLQSGSSNTFAPTSANVGAQLVCIVTATNAGGTAYARTNTTPAVTPGSKTGAGEHAGAGGRAGTRPTVAIRSVRCTGNACTVTYAAANAGARLSVRARAQYDVPAKCSRKRRGGRSTHCTRSKTIMLTVNAAQATAKTRGLPYGKQIRFTVTVTNGSGSATATVAKTLAKPYVRRATARAQLLAGAPR
jgi:secreted trypsin-like serine protease